VFVVNSHIQIPESEFEWSFVRSSGPGGQNVNKVSSKAVLRWKALASTALAGGVRERFLARYGRRLTAEGELIVSSQRYRDQRRNIDDALAKLRAMLEAIAQPPKGRRKTKPTRAAVAERIQSKQARSRIKQMRRFKDEE
jgi:ribosome-associated protein